MRSVVIIGRKSIERMLGLLCIIAATLIFGMSVKAAGPEEVAYVYLDEDVVGTSGAVSYTHLDVYKRQEES